MSIKSDYKRKLIKEVDIPSGFKFKIRAIGPLFVSRLMAENNLTNEEIQAGSNKFNSLMLKEAVVEPKLSLEPTDSEDELSVEDITNNDVVFLLREIISFSGLKEENNKEKVPLQKRK